MQLACLMFGFKPEKKHKGKFEHDKDGFFELSRLNLLSNPNQFLKNMIEYKKDNIAEKIVKDVNKIIEDTYVDDGVTGDRIEVVQRMVGTKDADGKYVDGTIARILARGNFKVKEFIVEGDMDQSDENLLGNKVFGYQFDPKRGILGIRLAMNLSKKKRNVRTKPDLT